MPAGATPLKSNTSIGQVLFNGLLFNVSWLLIVTTHSLLLAPVIAVAHLLVHFTFIGRGLLEARLVLVVSLLGFLLDQAFFAGAVLSGPDPYSFGPLWISYLWPVLATTLMHAFGTLQSRLVLAAVVGAVGGAASYLAGANLSDVEFVSPIWGPITMAITWAILFPSLLFCARVNAEAGQ